MIHRSIQRPKGLWQNSPFGLITLRVTMACRRVNGFSRIFKKNCQRPVLILLLLFSRASAQKIAIPPVPDYGVLKSGLVREFGKGAPGEFGPFVAGVKTRLKTNEKRIALTLDACGGKKGGGYNSDLIGFLRSERIPAALFVSGRWIDANPRIFAALAADTLFEIENHGLSHRVCSAAGRTVYGLPSTQNASDVMDEMELNARKISDLSGRRPMFFRSAAAFIDEASVRIAERLGMAVAGYSILPGDGVPFLPADSLKDGLIRNAVPGGIIIMHFNHPEWNEKRALEAAVPILRGMGYSFVRLKDFELVGP
jgi:peptidoglycan/xylan/chitin deacetylase (PgdA/CDA1 family)